VVFAFASLMGAWLFPFFFGGLIIGRRRARRAATHG
jgi:hypothetical protein